MQIPAVLLLGYVLAGLCTFESTVATLYTDAEQLSTTIYDFIIVGAGAAGNAVAARLTENPSFSVLLIEAGISDEGIQGVEVPYIAPQNLANTSITWNYTTIPQTGLDGQSIAYPRGRLLGGSSAINFLVYTRGTNEEYDRWAEITDDPGWSWDQLAPYYFKSSRLVPPADRHNTSGEVNPADHGFGPVEISLSGFPTEIDARVIKTAKAPGSEFPFNVDISSGKPLGVGYLQSTIGGGARSSSATAYLHPVLNNRPNLHVLTSNTVTRLGGSGRSDDGLVIVKSVEFAVNSTAKRSTVIARKEVILSAGSIGTPQILMLSGIGDHGFLQAMGIETLVDLPDVGRHLQDQPIMENYWTVSSNQTLDNVSRDPAVFNADLALWEKTEQNFTDPSAGPNTPHIELLPGDSFSLGPAPLPATGNFLTMHTIVVTPTSVGSVKLASSDPFTFPLIDPAFLSSDFDVQAMVYAVKAARRFLQTGPWNGFIVDRFGDVGSAETDDEIAATSRRNVETIWHPTSTARMSPKDASWGVVDPQLLVKGTKGLRIVDASVFPTYIAGHPIAAVYSVAERAADIIKETWS